MTKADQNTFLYVGNQVYVAQLFERYLDDPGSVDIRWQQFFADILDEPKVLNSEQRGASWAPSDARVVGEESLTPLSEQMSASVNQTQKTDISHVTAPAISGSKVREATLDSIRALMLIRAYRVRGHMHAKLDPLGIEEPKDHPELNPATYGFADKDLDRDIFINYVLGLESANLREIINILEGTYCGPIGIEYMHIQDPAEKSWLQERMESIQNQTHFTDKGKIAILQRLTETEGFEHYLDKKFTGTKRFGLDGGESLVPGIEQIIKRGGQLGLEEIVIGMAHRGRLNVLANVMLKPFQAIFSEFQGMQVRPDDVQGSGDVKYHLGTSADRIFDGRSVHLSLTANPSHLECVNTVVLGKVRAKQLQRNDPEREKVAGLLLHGDAAFSGQGLVAETFDLSHLYGYKTGGTIHWVINNQIGFTTSPSFSRSSPYCSDVAKIVAAPIFHVNADDPEAVVHCARIAIEYRQKFKKDVVVDMICYRRHGHNEGDEPSFTQPKMYEKIATHPTTRQIFSKRLVNEGVINTDGVRNLQMEVQRALDSAYDAAPSYKPNKADWLEGSWTGMTRAYGVSRRGNTAIPAERLKEIGFALARVPENFNLHSKLIRQMEKKQRMFESGTGIDWATAEALAFGSLLIDGHPVRLSGQDCGRGTFSQRHSVLIDQKTEDRYEPLNNIRVGQARYEVLDSPLSEAGVLGFEYGYSLAEPSMLIMWEAQFGDFANGAQVIIDQFIASGETKWLRMSGLIILLPHGFEGQGPEHSSARLERYLQLCAEDNLQVCNCTTPANYFHVLRRQLDRDFRKPLILMTPKSLLRNKRCVSEIDEMAKDTTFHRVLWDQAQLDGRLLPDNKIKRIVLCSGKVYYDLEEERDLRGIKNIYIMRIEQLYPFPEQVLAAELKRFPNANLVWCQEEPKNMGAWSHVREIMDTILTSIGHTNTKLEYIGRMAAASPATGNSKQHIKEQKTLVNEALTFEKTSTKKSRKK